MADPVRSKVKEDIFHVLRNSDDMLREFRSQIENKNIIIFVGNTRNGKSTLVNYITDIPLVAFQEEHLFRIEHQNGANVGATIAHGTLSHTTIPTIIELKRKPGTVIIDAPGFDDNRGAAQEILNALYINQIKYSKGVRFVLVSDINNIIHDNINYFLSFIETVHTIMPDLEKLKDAVSIIFTKDRKNYSLAEIVRLLRSKILDVEGLRCNKSLIKHFVDREDLIGLFKMPSEVGALTEDIAVNVQGAVFKSPVNLKESDIRFGISKSARIILLETYLEFFDVVNSLQITFTGFRVWALDNFSSFSESKLLGLPEEQLYSNAVKIMFELCGYVKAHKEQVSSVMQIPKSLQTLYVDEINRVAALIQDIEVRVPLELDARYNSDVIGNIRGKLEYIACIEKVVEKTNKSADILRIYKQSLDLFHKQVEELHEGIEKEMEHRKILTSQIKSVPSMDVRLREVDEQYLFASFQSELFNMKGDLEMYITISGQMLREISHRPPLHQNFTKEIHETHSVQRAINSKITDIDKHIKKRENEDLFKDIPWPLTSIMGSVIFYVGSTYIRSFGARTQLKVFAGSFLLFVAFSWKSTYMRNMFFRFRRRYHQKRLFTRRTKLDGCWMGLVSSETGHPYLRN